MLYILAVTTIDSPQLSCGFRYLVEFISESIFPGLSVQRGERFV